MKSASPEISISTASRLCRAKIRKNIKLNDSNFFILSLALESPVPAPRPGQFFMFGLDSRKDPLLKRPFCYFRRKGNTIDILYRVVGKVTTLMTGLKPADSAEILGPLGNFYPLEEASGKIPVVIAGGVGIASVYPLLGALAGRALLFYGGRTKKDILLAGELKKLSKKAVFTTEDGSIGLRGTAVDAARGFLEGKDKRDFILYACGPNGMLKAASALDVAGYIASEEKMACGIGVCLGCAVKTVGGYKRACKDGPVFKTGEVVFD